MPRGVKPERASDAERDGHRRGEVEHVDRAAAPHLAVDELAAERIAPPAVGVRGHDVGVAHQQQRRRGRIAALDARDEVLAPGPRLVALEVETVSPRYCASTSTLRDSYPDSAVPSLTHSLRIRCDEEIDRLVRRPRSSVARHARARRGFHAVDEHAVLLPPFGVAGVHEVLEVGERLALGHRAPVPLREHLVRQRDDRRGAEREAGVAQLLHALGVVFLDRLDAARHVGERMAVRGQPELHALQLADEIERREIRLQRVGLAHAGDVRRDRRQHVVAGEQRARSRDPTGTGGRRCGPGVCTHEPVARRRGGSARRGARGRSARAA